MRPVMLSVQPQWVERILSGKKTIEIRKTRPKLEPPFKCYIYQTKAKDRLVEVMKDGDNNYGEIYHGKNAFITTSSFPRYGFSQTVVAEFICDKIEKYRAEFTTDSCYEDIRKITINDDGQEEDIFITSVEFENPSKCYLCKQSCLYFEQIKNYVFDEKSDFFEFYGWHISDLKTYDNPKKLQKFKLSRAPQSWCYIKEDKNIAE